MMRFKRLIPVCSMAAMVQRDPNDCDVSVVERSFELVPFHPAQYQLQRLPDRHDHTRNQFCPSADV